MAKTHEADRKEAKLSQLEEIAVDDLKEIMGGSRGADYMEQLPANARQPKRFWDLFRR